MIVGPDFVWLHFPKCGGVATEAALHALLRGREGVTFDEVDNISGHWHDPIWKRQSKDPSFSIDGKRVICGFRRLPGWVLSLAHFEVERGQKPPTREMLLKGQVYSNNASVSADQMLKIFLRPRVDMWLRTENLADDLSSAFGLPLDDVRSTLKRRNETRLDYIKSLDFWFTPDDLRRLYAANPLWSETERRVYGDTLASASSLVA